MRLLACAIVSAASLAAGCTTDDTQRLDGMSFGAGNAIAANTAMQMVDPWPDGVQDTDLEVPAERASAAAAAPADGATPIGSASTADK